MAYRYGDRRQNQLFPQNLEDYVAEDDPVRAYDAFVAALDFAGLGIVHAPNKVGNPEYDPQAMLKLLVYGYSYGIRSSRKLERATHHNVSFLWLMGGLKPDHKTIARFRRDNLKSLKAVLKQCARLCVKLDLIEGNTLFVDGTKMRAAASIKHTWTAKRCERQLKKVDANIERILSECERIDDKESGAPSLVRLNDELKTHEALKARVESIQQELKANGARSVNTTDPDCVKVKGRQGTHAGYNGQIVVDEKHGLIASSDVVSESNDSRQFAKQIEQANKTIGKQCKSACGDAGYANTDELKKIDDENITVIVPSVRQAHDKPPKPFDKSQFRYDRNNDCYVCPQGNPLSYSFSFKDKRDRVYEIKSKSLCLACTHFGVCTTSKTGRRIRRIEYEDSKLKLEKQYQTNEGRAIYKLRKERVEHPFGHMKRNLGAGFFLLKGLDGVKAEMALLSSCFNLARMITLFGVPALVAELSG